MGQSYTIKAGDNLWNICKKQFKLTNNTDIAKKVNEIAKNNGISNPNLIFAGKELKLDGAMDTVVKQNTQTQEQTQAQKAADKRIEYNNVENYADLTKLSTASVSIFSEQVKTDEQKTKAYTEYSQRLLDEYYDLNKDGQVTVEEFAKTEQQGSEKAMEIQAKELQLEPSETDTIIAERSANLFTKNLDMNGDGIISVKELSFFNKNADACDGNTDGVIKNAGESAMFSAITGMNANDEEIKRVVNKYLLGEELSAEEQVILEKSSITIRNNMQKAADNE